MHFESGKQFDLKAVIYSAQGFEIHKQVVFKQCCSHGMVCWWHRSGTN